MNKVHKTILDTTATIILFVILVLFCIEIYELMVEETMHKEAVALSILVLIISYALGKFLEFTVSKLIALSKS
jgi:carbon starvation protein CstA